MRQAIVDFPRRTRAAATSSTRRPSERLPCAHPHGPLQPARQPRHRASADGPRRRSTARSVSRRRCSSRCLAMSRSTTATKSAWKDKRSRLSGGHALGRGPTGCRGCSTCTSDSADCAGSRPVLRTGWSIGLRGRTSRRLRADSRRGCAAGHRQMPVPRRRSCDLFVRDTFDGRFRVLGTYGYGGTRRRRPSRHPPSGQQRHVRDGSLDRQAVRP